LPTKIVCKYFLDAIENSKYVSTLFSSISLPPIVSLHYKFLYLQKQRFGWFWECPNGGKKCMYQHALPPGYVLKSEKKRLEDEAAAVRPPSRLCIASFVGVVAGVVVVVWLVRDL
jgi:hypothetical protein